MADNISRKNFLRSTAIALAAAPITSSVFGQALSSTKGIDNNVSVSIFSKHLSWLNYNDLAERAAKLGFDGIDLTVRPKGHVLPDRVKTDLPKAVEAITKAGLKVYNLATDIKDANHPYTADILATAAQLGIKSYRMGWYGYDTKLDTQANLAGFKKRMANLAAINERYKIHGDYENHTGLFGGPLWDLWETLKDLDPQWIGCQFDIRHATVDGAEAWPVNLDLLKSISAPSLSKILPGKSLGTNGSSPTCHWARAWLILRNTLRC
ncbi:sugar phosphate isomerase/epimerase family protein [Mucilaginibacter antarcticus]|uniref:sugar phosphate isomerase/epimerase family protein n=1 Tax=Mucilaginibacter antarcticus TaxID=1855725 RepID=UPI00363B5C07